MQVKTENVINQGQTMSYKVFDAILGAADRIGLPQRHRNHPIASHQYRYPRLPHTPQSCFALARVQHRRTSPTNTRAYGSTAITTSCALRCTPSMYCSRRFMSRSHICFHALTCLIICTLDLTEETNGEIYWRPGHEPARAVH